MLAEAIHGGLEAVGPRRRSTPASSGHAHRRRAGAAMRRRRRDADHRQPQPLALQRHEAVFRRRTSHSRRLGRTGLGAYRRGESAWVAARPPRHALAVARSRSAGHLDAVLATVDAASGSAAGGSACCWTPITARAAPLGRRLLEALGCQRDDPRRDARRPVRPSRPSRPPRTSPACWRPCPQAGADVGFCQDPDADRLAVIDAAGRYIGEEYTVALCVEHVLRQRRGPIVTNCSSSRMSQDLAERHGVPVFPLGGGRGQRRRRHARPRGDFRRRGQRRADRSRASAWSATVSSAWPCLLDAMAERELTDRRSWPTSCRATRS